MPENLYDSYVEFKGWSVPLSAANGDWYAFVIDRALSPGMTKILEIGFGRGDFLDWASAKGYTIGGVEIIPALVVQANARGHKTSLAPFASTEERYDAIVAFDVIEHLTIAQAADFFEQAARSLNPNGVVVLQFPNGQSPFSGLQQHGDLTHQHFLTPGALEQLSRQVGLQLRDSFNPRPLPGGFRGLKKLLVYAMRDLIEIFIGLAYFGLRIPMDSAIVAVYSAEGKVTRRS